MVRKRQPYLHHERTRHGTFVWYFRRPGEARVRLRAVYDSPEFWSEYRAALEGTATAPTSSALKPQTLAWALQKYRSSSAWAQLSHATRRQSENIFRAVVSTAGDTLVSRIGSDTIRAGRERRKDHPHAANNFLKTLRRFFKWASDPTEGNLVKTNPMLGVKLLKGRNKDGFHTWTNDEIIRFEKRWPIGTRERLALDLLLYTGLSRGDVVRLGKQHIRNGIIEFRMEKNRGEGVVYPPVLPILAATINATPKIGDLTFLVTERGTPFVKESFGNWFKEACVAAGVPGSAHGLRKAGATRAAENGATMHELMALFGWTTEKMALVYTRKADRKRLAQSAGHLLAPTQITNEKLPHPASGAEIKPKSSTKSKG